MAPYAHRIAIVRAIYASAGIAIAVSARAQVVPANMTARQGLVTMLMFVPQVLEITEIRAQQVQTVRRRIALIMFAKLSVVAA